MLSKTGTMAFLHDILLGPYGNDLLSAMSPQIKDLLLPKFHHHNWMAAIREAKYGKQSEQDNLVKLLEMVRREGSNLRDLISEPAYGHLLVHALQQLSHCQKTSLSVKLRTCVPEAERRLSTLMSSLRL